MSQHYYRNSYNEPVGVLEHRKRYIYGYYNSDLNQWAFKDDTGSTMINMCFEDYSYNILTCMMGIYTGNDRECISEEQYKKLL